MYDTGAPFFVCKPRNFPRRQGLHQGPSWVTAACKEDYTMQPASAHDVPPLLKENGFMSHLNAAELVVWLSLLTGFFDLVKTLLDIYREREPQRKGTKGRKKRR